MEKGGRDPSAPPAFDSGPGQQPVYPPFPVDQSYHPGGSSVPPPIGLYPPMDPGFVHGSSSPGYSSMQKTGPPPSYPGDPGMTKSYPVDQSKGYPTQPGYIPLHPGQPAQQVGGTTVIYQQQPVVASGMQQPPETFLGQIIFSCITVWCCFCPLGLTAFILAMIAHSKANFNREEAHKLGIASYVLAASAVVVQIIMVIVIVVLQTQAAGKYYEDNQIYNSG